MLYKETSDTNLTKRKNEQKKKPVQAQKKDQSKRKQAETFNTVSCTVYKGYKIPRHNILDYFYIFEKKALKRYRP